LIGRCPLGLTYVKILVHTKRFVWTTAVTNQQTKSTEQNP